MFRDWPIMQGTSSAGRHATGLIYGVVGVLLLSPDTLIIRLVNSDPWTFIAWRGILMALGLFVVLGLRHRWAFWRHTRAIGWTGLVLALVFAANNVAFQLSVQSTLVANTLAIIATAPLFAAFFSVLFLNERVPLRTWVAILVSGIGVAIVFASGFGTGDMFGNVMALAAAAGLGMHFVLIRRRRSIDMAPAICVGGLFICLAGVLVAPDLYLSPRQFGYVTLLGLVLLPLSFLFLTWAPRLIPAPEVSLILLLETILGPLWVWMAIREEPTVATLAGGALIIAVLVCHAIISLRAGRKVETG